MSIGSLLRRVKASGRVTPTSNVSSATVLAPGASTPRSLAARAGDVVNVKDYGAVGNGSADDTTALRAALAAAGTLKPFVFLPPGTYLTDTLTLPSYVSLVGAGWNQTILRPTDDDNSTILIDRINGNTQGYLCEIRGLRIVGHEAGAGHGIESTATNDGATGFRLRDVYVYGMGGDGIHLGACWTASLEHVEVSNCIGHQFYLRNAINTVRLTDCYARGVPTAGKAGFRILEGRATFINCNGIDPTATGAEFWGIFGAKIADGDEADTATRVSFIGCNVEDFKDTGIILRNNSRASFDNTAFVAPATGTVKALYIDNGANTIPVFWTITNTVGTKGAAWADGFMVHARTGPGMVKIGSADFTSTFHGGAYGTVVPSFEGVDANQGMRIRGGVYFNTSTARVNGHYSATAAWAPNIADGAVASTTVTVTGAALGDTVAVGFNVTGGVPAGVIISGSVTSANTVTVTARNDSGGVWNPGSGTLRADVWQH